MTTVMMIRVGNDQICVIITAGKGDDHSGIRSCGQRPDLCDHHSSGGDDHSDDDSCGQRPDLCDHHSDDGVDVYST